MTTPPVSPDVIVVGGGVIGAACARAAVRRGLRVTLYEPGPDPAAASPASAGMLAAQIEPDDDALLALAIRGRDSYEPLAADLKDTTGMDIGWWRQGIASVAFDTDGARRLRDAAAHQRQKGLTCDWLEADEVLARWPGIAPDALGALFAPEDGAVDPAALTRALHADNSARGVQVARDRVGGLTITGGRVTGVAVNGADRPAAAVVLAAGAWTPALAGLPRAIRVEPVRGQMALAPWPAPTPPAILYYDHAYVLAREGHAVLGSTMEHTGFDCRVTDAGLATIRAGAARLLPALATAPFERSWAGLRPVTPDGRPIISPDPQVTGLWYAVGHGRNGILLAALTGEIIGAKLAGEDVDIDLDPFRVDRAFPES